MNNLLKHFCRNNELKCIQEILNKAGLNILMEGGICFYFAISNNNAEICQLLLDYFENKQFAEKDESYKEGREQLIEILEDATSGEELSYKMKNVLSSYLGGFDDQFETSENHSIFFIKEALTVVPDNFVISDKRLVKHHDNTSTDLSVNSNNQFIYEYKPLITNTQDDIDVKYNDLNNNTTFEKNLHDSINTADTFGIGEQQDNEENEVQVLGDDN